MKRASPDQISSKSVTGSKLPSVQKSSTNESTPPLLRERPTDTSEAEERARQTALAMAGDPEAQYFVGHCHEVGSHELPENIDIALAWYEFAAQKGHANALRKVAAVHDLKARSGDVDSRFQLGMMYARGTGVTQNFQFAASWLKSAADKGHAMAMLNFGALLENGQGVRKDVNLALDYYRQAADQGCLEAKCALAKILAPAPMTDDTTPPAEEQWNGVVVKGKVSVNVSSGQWPHFCDWLKRARHVAAIEISSDLSDPARVQDLFSALEAKGSDTDLNLASCKINSDGVSALCKALQSSTRITGLNLSGNGIEAWRRWAARGDWSMDEDCARAWAEAIKHNKTLKNLVLDDHVWIDDVATVLAEGLKSNSTLSHLSLRRCQLDCADIEALAPALRNHPSLKRVNLSINQIACPGAKALAAVIEANTTIKELYLGQNQLGSLGVAAIAGAMQGNTTLTRLDVSYNRVTLDGVAAMAHALESNRTLLHCEFGEDSFANRFPGPISTYHLNLRCERIQIEKYLARNNSES